MNKQKWDLKTIVLYGINSVIGSGIFLLPGSAYKSIGASSVFAYLFVFALVMSIALCFAECASRFEESGGPYLYSRKAFGNFIGYEVGVMKWIVSIIAWAAMAVGFVTAMSAIYPPLADPLTRKMVSTVIIIVLSIVNLYGVNIMAYLNNISTVAKLIPLLIFVIGGLFFTKLANFTPLMPENISSSSIATAIIVVFYAFTGFENIGIAAGDMENPKVNVPKALIISMTFVSVVYFFVQFNCVGTLGNTLGNTSTPVSDAMGTFLGSSGKLLVTIGTLISIGGINIAGSFNTPRCASSLAEGGLLPTCFCKRNSHNVPYIAVLITGVLSLILAFSGSFVELAAISVVSRFTQYIPTCLAVPFLRKGSTEAASSFRVPGGYFFPVLAVVVSVWLLANTDSFKLLAGLGGLIVIAPLYFLMHRKVNISVLDENK